MSTTESDRVRRTVRAVYAARVSGCCSESASTSEAPTKEPTGSSCCAPAESAESACSSSSASGEASSCCASADIGYSAAELAELPEGADLGLGCGNPTAIASLTKGQTVVDLGSGGGIDCFLAANRVAPTGRVIGVDMTPEMIDRARDAAEEGNFSNVEFRLGEIEHLPLADATADVVISNCVINLSPDKAAVYREAFRVLKPGGRIVFSDIVALRPIPDAWKQDVKKMTGCIAGAELRGNVERWLADAGFTDVRVTPAEVVREAVEKFAPELPLDEYITSATIEAVKPS